MIAATDRRTAAARILAVSAAGDLRELRRSALAGLVRPADVVIANDAATLPASLRGIHQRTGRAIEIRIATRPAIDASSLRSVVAVIFGEGDHRQRTEDRPPPPHVQRGDRLRLGALQAVVEGLLDHPRLAALRFEGAPRDLWAAVAEHGRPIQYAHLPVPLQLWDVWTPIAAYPAAVEPPSAGFALSWTLLAALRAQGTAFATLTHAAGLSSTGDPGLDARLPLDEPYRIPASVSRAIARARAAGGRVIAVGTSVVRALEDAADAGGGVSSGDGIATRRLGAHSRLQVVDALLSGTHDAGTSHHALLGAFMRAEVLRRVDAELDRRGFRTHEFGDAVFVERSHPAARVRPPAVDPPAARVLDVECDRARA